MKRTWQPKKNKHKKTHGFRIRMKSKKGRNIINQRRTKGRKILSA